MANTQTAKKTEVPVLALTDEQIKELTALQTVFSAPEIEMIAEENRASYYPDFRRFIYRCAKLGLDPLANEIHMEYRMVRDQARAQFFVHIDGYRRKADETGNRGGFSQARGDDTRGEYVESTLWRRDALHPFISRVYFHEFLTPGQALHNKMQYHMVAKAGEAAVYRQAFPFAGGDVHSADEGRLWNDEQPTAAEARPSGDEYVIAEKDTTVSAEVSSSGATPEPLPAAPTAQVDEQSKPAAETPPATGPSAADQWKAIAKELDTAGVNKARVKQASDLWFASSKIDKPGKNEHLKAIMEIQATVSEIGVPAFLARLDELTAPAQVTTAEPTPAAQAIPHLPEPFTQASGEFGMVADKFRQWPFGLQALGALWCFDQVKNAGQLEAFLISQGADKFTQGKLEAFLAITRHIPVSQAPVLLQFCGSFKPEMSLSEFEAELSKRAGVDVAKAPFGLPANQVADKFLEMVRAGK